MTHRDRIKAIIAKEQTDRTGFWLGNPHSDSWQPYYDYFKCTHEEEVRVLLNDDFRWICPQWVSYKDDSRQGLFMTRKRITGNETYKTGHGTPGPFANCDSLTEIDDYPWPSLDNLDFTDTLNELDQAGDVYRASGFWTSFFHDLADLFGMEEYFTKMYTHPDIVHEVTRRVCEFYYNANTLFFNQAKDRVDGFFFGNDFGTQLDLLVSPNLFDEFIMPWFKRFTQQGHEHGYQVILHSCGAIHRVIESLIEADVDALHPLQAKAANMDADTLNKEFNGRISFIGGIDTQWLLVNGTPDEIKKEVHRVQNALGPHVVISPSHEALLPNVPPQNVEAMAKAATEN